MVCILASYIISAGFEFRSWDISPSLSPAIFSISSSFLQQLGFVDYWVYSWNFKRLLSLGLGSCREDWVVSVNVKRNGSYNNEIELFMLSICDLSWVLHTLTLNRMLSCSSPYIQTRNAWLHNTFYWYLNIKFTNLGCYRSGSAVL